MLIVTENFEKGGVDDEQRKKQPFRQTKQIQIS